MHECKEKNGTENWPELDTPAVGIVSVVFFFFFCVSVLGCTGFLLGSIGLEDGPPPMFLFFLAQFIDLTFQ